MKRALLLLVFLHALAPSVRAHEVRPAYLELRQTSPETYDVLWKVPGLGNQMRLGIYVELPEGSTNLSEPGGSFVNGGFIERWKVHRAGGLSGSTIHIAGLSVTATDVLVRVGRLDGTTQVTRLTPANPSFLVEASPDNLQVVRTYLVLGVEHIWLGVDHLLFVFGLLLLVKSRWMLLKTITAFTVAHSITLGAGDARLCASSRAAAQCRHRALDPDSRCRDRPFREWRDEHHHPASMDRGLRLWIVARLRLCQRT